MVKHTEQPLIVAQISDCHLFAEMEQQHYGANVYDNLLAVLTDIGKNTTIDVVIFTGDLTQDHSEQSYNNFSVAVKKVNISIPVLFLAGNHDDEHLLIKHLTGTPFSRKKIVNAKQWQLILINSKSDTPAGFVDEKSCHFFADSIDDNKFQLCFMHHHPVDVGYFIDRHGLQNKADFWQVMNQHKTIKGIACGHIHQALHLKKHTKENTESIDIYTCPATSIQFDPEQMSVAALSIIPAYRLFYLYDDGRIDTDVIE